ncbi:serine and arginine rich splicing factor 2a isoform X4 [Esox lucius]|uniref:serine and arginine rich splicing factor 2a isoform X4 n=1 Tax=Esox lucius TaxID=8010 RepID=UPI00147694F3|nr:serine and arginine rich splicing factor 2a isoform X4 [Esox lucius]
MVRCSVAAQCGSAVAGGGVAVPCESQVQLSPGARLSTAAAGCLVLLSVKQCLTINPASAPVDIPVRDVGHLQFPEGPSFLCPFSYEQTLATTEIPEDSNNMKEVDIDSGPLKYVPGMLRTSQLEKMMTKEELEEEQRVQREQLAAIFQLLKENQETFGDVSEGDMEEQLRLYNI